jgi:hypothetical protein
MAEVDPGDTFPCGSGKQCVEESNDWKSKDVVMPRAVKSAPISPSFGLRVRPL